MKEYNVKLTAEECVSLQNVLGQQRDACGVITAREEIERLIRKFKNPV